MDGDKGVPEGTGEPFTAPPAYPAYSATSPGAPISATHTFPVPSMAIPVPVSAGFPPPEKAVGAGLNGVPVGSSSLMELPPLRIHASPKGSIAISRGELRPPPLKPPPADLVVPEAKGDNAAPCADNSVTLDMKELVIQTSPAASIAIAVESARASFCPS